MYKRQIVDLLWLQIGDKPAAIALNSIHEQSMGTPEQDPLQNIFVQAIIRPKTIKIHPLAASGCDEEWRPAVGYSGNAIRQSGTIGIRAVQARLPSVARIETLARAMTSGARKCPKSKTIRDLLLRYREIFSVRMQTQNNKFNSKKVC